MRIIKLTDCSGQPIFLHANHIDMWYPIKIDSPDEETGVDYTGANTCIHMNGDPDNVTYVSETVDEVIHAITNPHILLPTLIEEA